MKTTEMMVLLADQQATAEAEQNRITTLHRELNDVRNNLTFIQGAVNRLMFCNDPDAPQAIRAIRLDMREILEQIAFI